MTLVIQKLHILEHFEYSLDQSKLLKAVILSNVAKSDLGVEQDGMDDPISSEDETDPEKSTSQEKLRAAVLNSFHDCVVATR